MCVLVLIVFLLNACDMLMSFVWLFYYYYYYYYLFITPQR